MQFGIVSLIIGLFLTPADALSGIIILFKPFDNIDTALLFGYSDVGDFMMVTVFRSWWQNHDIDEFFTWCWRVVQWWFSECDRLSTSKFGHRHQKVVTNTFRLQHPSPTSVSPFYYNDIMNAYKNILKIYFVAFFIPQNRNM